MRGLPGVGRPLHSELHVPKVTGLPQAPLPGTSLLEAPGGDFVCGLWFVLRRSSPESTVHLSLALFLIEPAPSPPLSRNFLLHESKTISRLLVSGNLSGKGRGLDLGLRSWKRSPDWRRVAMAPPPPPPLVEGEQQLTVADGQRPMPTPFLTKTYQLVDDPAIDNVISSNEDGTTFIVW